MSCLTTHDAIRRGQLESPEVRDHLAECDACAELAAFPEPWAALPTGSGEPEERLSNLASMIQEQAAQRQSWLPRQPHTLRVGLTMAAAVALLTLTALLSPRPDLSQMSHAQDWLVLGALLTVAIPCVFLAMRRVDRTEQPPQAVYGVVVTAVGVSLLATAAGASVDAIYEHFWPPAVACLLFGGVFGAVAWAIWYAGERRSWLEPHSAIVGAVGCALLGQASLQLHCPINDVGHLMVGHAALGPLGLAAAWMLAQRQRP